jgi:glycosyltransferase involved in cell wall biosynthesis
VRRVRLRRRRRMQPLISIVLATRNRKAQLRRCLESLRTGSLPAGWKAEIIVVDNASLDDTASVVASFQAEQSDRSFHYMREPRRGKSFAVNRGLSAVRGSIVAFVDDDVVVDSRWMLEIIGQFQHDPGLDLLAGRVVTVEVNGRREGETGGAGEFQLSAKRPLVGLVMGCNLAVRREVIETVKGRDTRLGPGRGLSAEDIDFVYRILKANFSGRFSERPIVAHDPGSRDRRREYLRGRGAYYAKYVSRGDLVVARQAWWELSAILREIRHPAVARASSPLNDLRQLAWGAGLMLGRVVKSMFARHISASD